MVVKGTASPALLETYNTERQPVGKDLVKWSNELLRNHGEFFPQVYIGVSGGFLSCPACIDSLLPC
jgi:hypothetical protein